jgi:hypothetical protein
MKDKAVRRNVSQAKFVRESVQRAVADTAGREEPSCAELAGALRLRNRFQRAPWPQSSSSIPGRLKAKRDSRYIFFLLRLNLISFVIFVLL